MRARVVVCALALAGCYRPHIADGDFTCGPNGLCPDGYMCNELMLCVKNGEATGDLGASAVLYGGGLGPIDLTGATGTLYGNTRTGELQLVGTDSSMMDVVMAQSQGWTRLTQASGPTISIWSFSSLFVPSTVVIKPASASEDDVLVFASAGSLEIDGAIDWRGYGGSAGQIGQAGAARLGGAPSVDGGQPGLGSGGGGGGGYGTAGTAAAGLDGGQGGAAFGSPDLMPVLVGAGGGGGGGAGGPGGAGGGAVVLAAAGTLTLSNTSGGSAPTAIDVSGNVGSPASNVTAGGGGGGGAGGSILLSGREVKVLGGYTLDAAGGGGGAGFGGGTTGGTGGAGRVWIGGTLDVDGALESTPMAVRSDTQLTGFAGTTPAN